MKTTTTEPFSCESCPTEVSCASLKCASIILDKLEEVDANSAYVEEIEALKADIQDTGYSYPDGVEKCDLVEDQAAAIELVKRATTLLQKVTYHKDPMNVAG